MALAVTSMLRRWVGLHPEDAQLKALVEDLLGDEDFGAWWAQYDISCPPLERQRFHHPAVGDVVLDCQTLHPVDEAEQSITICTAQPGSPDERALRLLGGRDAVPAERSRYPCLPS